jgi:hypothetical protein
MCGNFFGDDSDDQMDQSGARKSRVRQRTVTVDQGDIAEMKAELGKEDIPSSSSQPTFLEEDSFSMATEEFASALDRTIDSSPEEAEDLDATTLASSPVFPSSFSSSAFPNPDESSSFVEPVEADEPTFSSSFRENPADDFSAPQRDSASTFGAPFPSKEPLGIDVPAEEAQAAVVAPVSEVEKTEDAQLSVVAPEQAVTAEGESAEPKKKRRRRRRKRKNVSEVSEDNQNNGHHAAKVDAINPESVDTSNAEPLGVEANNSEADVDDDFGSDSEISTADVLEKRELGSRSSESVASVVEESEMDEQEKVEKISESAVMASQEEEIERSPKGKPSRGRGQRNGRTDAAPSEDAGILMGWLVNYAQDVQGFSIELRSGRYFVGRKSLREDDVVIPDTAISTPHCLVTATKEDGLQVQDLMSEQGTFIKRKGSNSFVQIQDTVEVQHGDTLRFGAYEAVVCLVP